ncbi:MAG: class I SAM-dependent methyltransferase [Anaerolineae bacterium]
MSMDNPSKLEAWLYLRLGSTLGRRIYKSYIDSLPLTGNERILNFGSGPGIEARLLAGRLLPGGGRVTCLDYSPSWIEFNRRELRDLKNVDYLQGDITTLEIGESSYDALVCHLVLHHVQAEQRPAVVAAWTRIVRPGGRLYIREPLGERGIRLHAIREHLALGGWREVSWSTGKLPVLGSVLTGIYELSTPEESAADLVPLATIHTEESRYNEWKV